MDYNKAFEHGKKKVLFNETASGLFKFTEKTPNIMGTLIKIEPFKRGIFGKASMRYTMKTTNGEETFFLSNATDKMVKDVIRIGGRYSITFLGQKELSNGRRMNNFHIEQFIDVEEEQEKEEIREVNQDGKKK